MKTIPAVFWTAVFIGVGGGHITPDLGTMFILSLLAFMFGYFLRVDLEEKK